MKQKTKKRRNSNYHTKEYPNGKLSQGQALSKINFSIKPIRQGDTAYCEECGQRNPGMTTATDAVPLFDFSTDGGTNFRTLCAYCMNTEINKCGAGLNNKCTADGIPLTEQIHAMLSTTQQPTTKRVKEFVMIDSKETYISNLLKKIPQELLTSKNEAEIMAWLRSYYASNGEPYIRNQRVTIEQCYQWITESLI